MRILMLIGLVLPMVSGTTEAMIGSMLSGATGRGATQAMKSAIQATRPTVQLPVSANKFVEVLLAETCNDCLLLKHIHTRSTSIIAEHVMSLHFPAEVNKAYDELQKLYSLLERSQQQIDESADSWLQELVQAENDNYQQLLDETVTAINQMFKDLDKVYLEYQNKIELVELIDDSSSFGLGVATSIAGGSAIWGMETEKNPLQHADDREKTNQYDSTTDDLALMGAALLISSGGHSDETASNVTDIDIGNNMSDIGISRRHYNLNLETDTSVGKAFADNLYGNEGVGGIVGNSPFDNNSTDAATEFWEILLSIF